MKYFAALILTIAAGVAADDNPSPSSNIIEARATSPSLPTITQRGNAFWNGTDRFYLRGIDYQPGGSSKATDPLSNPSTCKRDIKYFKELGLNTIRVYTVDNSANHDECMAALADAGIYLVLDVNTPSYSLNREDPGTSYNPTYLQSVFATIDAFAEYTNTLLFLSGNEVVNKPDNTNTAPYVKAVTRDLKQYLGERGYRSIPVGYSAADVSQNQYLMAQYMDCGDEPSRSDFYAINNYEWCDPSSFQQSGWEALVEQYRNYSIPLFLSEYGCITNQRTFQETAALYQPDMTGVVSGGLVYEYAEEGDGFGIVKISGDNVTPIGSQFSDLQKELAKAPAPSGDAGFEANNPPQQCPGQSDNWDTKPFTGSDLPATPSGALKYFKQGAGKGPGLGGDGSQNAPGGSSATASSNAGAVTATYGNGSPTSTKSGAAVAVHSGRMSLVPFAVNGVVVALGFTLGVAIF